MPQVIRCMNWIKLPESKPGERTCFGCSENKKFFGMIGQPAPWNSDNDTEFWEYEYSTGWKRIFCRECMKDIWQE